MIAHDLSHKQFTAKDVYRILGVDKNRLFHWINTHRLLEPDFDEGGGRGNRRRFSRNNLLELAIIRELHHYGIDLRIVQQIKKILDAERIEAKREDGKWVRVWQKDAAKTRKLNLYDWAFKGDAETRIRFYYDAEGRAMSFYTLIGEKQDGWDRDMVKKISSYLTINIKKLASSIVELATKG
jgi:DNA-binding transcriptional MerR regulator